MQCNYNAPGKQAACSPINLILLLQDEYLSSQVTVVKWLDCRTCNHKVVGLNPLVNKTLALGDGYFRHYNQNYFSVFKWIFINFTIAGEFLFYLNTLTSLL